MKTAWWIMGFAVGVAWGCEQPARSGGGEATKESEVAGPPIEPPSSEAVAAAKEAGLAPLDIQSAVGPYLIEGGDFVYIRRSGEALRLDLDEPRIEYGDVKEGRVQVVMTLHGVYEVAGDGSTMLLEDPLTRSERLARGPHYDATLEVFHGVAEPRRAALPEGSERPPTVKVDASWLKPYATFPKRIRGMGCRKHEVDGVYVGCF